MSARRGFLAQTAAVAGACWLQLPEVAAAAAAAAAAAGPHNKILRTAFNAAEVGFDLPQVSDVTSVTVGSNFFEPPLTAVRLPLADLTYHPHKHPVRVDMARAQVRGFLRHPFRRDRWRFVDMEQT